MKKVILVFLVLLVFFITGCENTTNETIKCDINQIEENGECVDVLDDETCASDQELIDDVCQDIVDVPDRTDDEMFLEIC